MDTSKDEVLQELSLPLKPTAKENNPNKYLLIVVILFVLLLGFICLTVGLKGKKTSTSYTDNPQPTVTLNKNWVTYKNPSYYYTLEYPSGWTIEPATSEMDRLVRLVPNTGKVHQQGEPEFEVIITETDNSLEQYMQNECKVQFVTKCSVLNTAQDVTVGGMRGKKIENIDFGYMKAPIIIYLKDQIYMYVLRASGDFPSAERTIPEHIINSFVFHDIDQNESRVSELTKNKYGWTFKYPKGWRVFYYGWSEFKLYPNNSINSTSLGNLSISTGPTQTLSDWENANLDNRKSGWLDLRGYYTIESIRIGNRIGYHFVPKDPNLLIAESSPIPDRYLVLTQSHSYEISLPESLKNTVFPDLYFY